MSNQARLLLHAGPATPVRARQLLHAYGVIVVSVERTRTGGVKWTTVEETGDLVRRRTYASGPGGHGYWERVVNPDGGKTWRLLREEFYLPWRHSDWYARLRVEKAVYAELWQQWGTW